MEPDVVNPAFGSHQLCLELSRNTGVEHYRFEQSACHAGNSCRRAIFDFKSFGVLRTVGMGGESDIIYLAALKSERRTDQPVIHIAGLAVACTSLSGNDSPGDSVAVSVDDTPVLKP